MKKEDLELIINRLQELDSGVYDEGSDADYRDGYEVAKEEAIEVIKKLFKKLASQTELLNDMKKRTTYEIIEIPTCGYCGIEIQEGVILCPGCDRTNPPIKYRHLAVSK